MTQARIGLRKATSAGGQARRALKTRTAPLAGSACTTPCEFERLLDGGAQRGFLARCTQHLGHRQFDAVLDEAFELGNGSSAPTCRRRAIVGRHGGGPAGQLAVMTLAVRDQRRQQFQPLARKSRSRVATMASGLCGAISSSQSGQYCIASRT